MTGRLAKAIWGLGRDDSLAQLAETEDLDLSDRPLSRALELAAEIQDFRGASRPMLVASS